MENNDLMQKMFETLQGLDVMMQEQGKAVERLDVMMQEQQKEIREIKERLTNVEKDVTEIKQTMVTKQEFKKLDVKMDIFMDKVLEHQVDIKELKNRSA